MVVRLRPEGLLQQLQSHRPDGGLFVSPRREAVRQMTSRSRVSGRAHRNKSLSQKCKILWLDLSTDHRFFAWDFRPTHTHAANKAVMRF
jgi:hypothetical protein